MPVTCSTFSISAGLSSLLDIRLRTRLVSGPGSLDRLGFLARECGMHRVLLVTDAGLLASGHAGRAQAVLQAAGLEVGLFSQVIENPTSLEVEACRRQAGEMDCDGLVGLGGGSSIDTARGCNFVLTQGGQIQDYWGTGKATGPMLPLIAVPTTAGTGSEVQSYALISDPVSHRKMACGDVKAAAAVAILDPELTYTQPARVTALTGLDTVVHALESAVCKQRTPLSKAFSMQSLCLSVGALPRVLADADDRQARADMQWAACLAGLAIENSMLGSSHAAANPLTARYGLPHGLAVACMAPAVIRRNSREVGALYRQLALAAGLGEGSLADWLEDRILQAGFPLCPDALRAEDVAELARLARQEWTGQFNPIESDFEELYADVLGLAGRT